jgi:hypothetical protein
MREQGIKTLKTNYATLVESTITSQDDLDAFVKEMNELNRER